jgi:hypothetical protein
MIWNIYEWGGEVEVKAALVSRFMGLARGREIPMVRYDGQCRCLGTLAGNICFSVCSSETFYAGCISLQSENLRLTSGIPTCGWH